MSSTDAHLEFAPVPDRGNGRALVLAVSVHALLLLALNWGTLWSQQPQDMSVEAELWSAIPQPVAPAAKATPEPEIPPTPEPEPPAPVAPPAKPAQATPPVVDPQIAIDKLKKKQAEEKQQAQEEKKAKLKAAKEEEAKRKAQEKQEAEARHQAAVKRLQSMAGSTGSPVDTGVAPKASGPSASYIGRLRAKVKPNITFPDNLLQNMVGNPTAEVEVTCSPSGKIEDVNLLKSSGNKAWDDAVVNGLYKTAMLPRDVDGSVPTRLVFSFRPRGD